MNVVLEDLIRIWSTFYFLGAFMFITLNDVWNILGLYKLSLSIFFGTVANFIEYDRLDAVFTQLWSTIYRWDLLQFRYKMKKLL